MSDPTFRCLIVGDLHGCWGEEDTAFLESYAHDLVLFVGDLGDEDVEIVADIGAIPVRKGVILGNHDAWQSFSAKRPTARLLASLEELGRDHLGYARREIPAAGLTLIGARPFSWGGADMRSPELYGELYGVRSMEESAQRIAALADEAESRDIVILAHNGPRGLGSNPAAIYGKDFGRHPGGDWGDRDLAWAIEQIEAGGRRVRAVIAGHMHDRLSVPRGKLRRRFVRRGETAFLNPAVVPRLRRRDGADLRHFMLTDWCAGRLVRVEELWVDDAGRVRHVEQPEFVELAVR